MSTREQQIRNLFDNMSAMKRGMHSHLQSFMRNCPISRSQLELLTTIKDMQPVSSKDLANHLYLTAGAVSQLTEGLENNKLIERKIDPVDKRKQQLQVSKQGSKLLQDLEKKRRKMMEAVLSELDDEELDIWIRVQDKMMKQFQIELTTEKNMEK